MRAVSDFPTAYSMIAWQTYVLQHISFCEIKQQTLNIKSSAKSNNQLYCGDIWPFNFIFILTNLYVALKNVKVYIPFKKKVFEITFQRRWKKYVYFVLFYFLQFILLCQSLPEREEDIWLRLSHYLIIIRKVKFLSRQKF